MNTPASTNGIRVSEIVTAPTIPIAAAPVSERIARATSVWLERWVLSGLPCSSSSTCAPTPTARKNAAKAAASRPGYRCGASEAPIATLARFHAVYGGWRSVTRSRHPPGRSA